MLTVCQRAQKRKQQQQQQQEEQQQQQQKQQSHGWSLDSSAQLEELKGQVQQQQSEIAGLRQKCEEQHAKLEEQEVKLEEQREKLEEQREKLEEQREKLEEQREKLEEQEVGFVFPICWIVGAFLPLCAKNKNNRRAAIGSGVMIAVYAILLGVLLGIALSPGSCINQLGGEVCYNKFTGVCKLTAFGVTYAANCGSYRFN
ncbi:hypothetical protein OEZ85_000308 [Tetradesmus obliquus]|uniref:Amino acid transporter transmembrane domain-containing protein n=1 Tax=Tetradesmus obliquus TaxID=3088 RepID=A0ABY8UTE0_TETOB|nr:hypothetical protein OEZ85_000308 [Tetradesmus obliquus]